MLKNYFKIALRNLAKRKLFTGINILGLSVAIACSLLLFLTAFRELSYDRFHENGANIYRTYLQSQAPDGTKISTVMCVPFLPALKEKVPGVEYGTRWSGTGASMTYGEKNIGSGIRFADPDFLKMFSFPLIKGDPTKALSDPGNIILHENRVKELFGEEDPMGKSVRLNYEGVSKNFIVSGVLKELPPQSSFSISSIVSFENSPGYVNNLDNWDDRNHDVYIQIAPQVKVKDFEARFPAFVQDVFANDIEQLTESGWKSDEKGNLLRLGLQAYFDLRFGTALKADSSQNARGYIFPIALIIMGLFILIIACINFINLNIGSSVNRYIEVGIRKVLGASRGQLTLQFWGESFVVVFIATIIALMGVQWSLPQYNSLFRHPVSMDNPFILLAMVLILLFVVIIGGAYPAFLISKFQPASVLKKQTQLQKPGKLRNLLVVIQFAISIILISATIVVYQQLNYLQEKPLGFNKEQVISLPVGDNIRGERALSLLKQKLKDQPDILNITGSYNNYGMGLDGSAVTSIMGFMQEGKQMYSHWMGTHFDYLKTLEIELLAGRGFDPQLAQDSVDAVVINESLAQQLGKAPTELIGTKLETDPDHTIIGVVKDFHFKSLNQAIEPLSLVINPEFGINYVMIKTRAGSMAQTMELLQRTWKEISPKSVFEASFLDENVNRQYKSEATLSKIVLGAALLTILLSCMGLFAIALLTIVQRTKEIGIRKVLGASISQIVTLISKDFIAMVLVACLIAIPFSWYGVNQWLQDFHYRIEVSWWNFALAGLIACVIAFLTVSIHSLRAAMANPTQALKSE